MLEWSQFCKTRRVAWKDALHHRYLSSCWAECLGAEHLSRPELEELKQANLDRLVADVAVHVPFYQCWAAESGFQPGDRVRLADLPIVTKHDYLGAPEAFQSVRYKRSQMVQSRTSGSSGQPFPLRCHPESSDYSYACLWRNLRRHGLRPGMKRCYIWGGSWQFSAGRLESAKKQLMLWGIDFLNSSQRVDAYRLHGGRVQAAVARIQRFDPEYIHGYVSAIYVLARHVVETGQERAFPSLRVIVTESEKLYDFQRRCIEQAFSVPVVEVYGSVEMGSVAMQDTDGVMRINEDMFLVERDDLGRAVMTNCKAAAFPFIRYLQGDVIEVVELPGGNLPFAAISDVVGRTVDLIPTSNGGFVHGVALAHVIDPHLDFVEQYQLHQTRNEMVVKLVLRKPMPVQRKEKIAMNLRALLGESNIRFDFPSAIEPDKSGKLRWVKSDLIPADYSC